MGRRLTPFQFATAAAVYALAIRAIDWLAGGALLAVGDAGAPLLAWWAIVGMVFGLIWDGVQVAYHAIVIALQWSVQFLWTVATATANALVTLGRVVWRGLREIWEFARWTYREVLRPAWDAMKRIYDRVRAWLDRYVKPIYDFLLKIRRKIIEFYERFVRPVLETIGIARRVLQLLARLGVDWARTLDQKLAWIEQRITSTYLQVLGKLNELVNAVNMIVDRNGLLQRFPLVRSIQRDIDYVQNLWWNAAHKENTPEQKERARTVLEDTPVETHASEVRLVVHGQTGPLQSRVSEEVADLRLMLRAQRRGGTRAA